MLDRFRSAQGWATCLLVFMASRPALAEVMDKELQPREIWHYLLLSLGLALVVALVHPWLLIPAYLFGPAGSVAFAWTEWHDPLIGPAIGIEAGPSYGLHADGAMAFAVFMHLLLWFLARQLRQPKSGQQYLVVARPALIDVAFTLAVLVVTILYGAAGFSLHWSLVLSAPIVIASLASLCVWLRFRKNRVRLLMG